jgi:hypothetical protein
MSTVTPSWPIIAMLSSRLARLLSSSSLSAMLAPKPDWLSDEEVS